MRLPHSRGGLRTARAPRGRGPSFASVTRQSKYLNNIVEHDHRAVKRVVRPMLGFKPFWSARCTIAGIELTHTIRKGQLVTSRAKHQTPAECFSAVAA